jgi:cell division protein FtsX
MNAKTFFAIAAAALLASGAISWSQNSDANTSTAKPDPRIDKLLQQNEEILKNQAELLKNQAQMMKDIEQVQVNVMRLRRQP